MEADFTKNKMKVLIAEKSDLIFHKIRSLLDDSFLVKRVTSTQELLSEHPSYFSDLVIINIDLLKSNFETFHFCRSLRKVDKERHTGLLFLAGDETSSSKAAYFLDSGGDDFQILSTCSNEEMLSRIKKIIFIKKRADLLRGANYRLNLMVKTDDLTGLANMKGFVESYALAIESCRNMETHLGLIMIDLDYFKNINDETNHLMGSFCLSQIGRILGNCRHLSQIEGSLARYGGDEFIAFCKPHSYEDLNAAAEEVRSAIEAFVFKYEGFTRSITASLGFCFTPKGFQGSGDELIKAADTKLYESKKFGRNAVYGTKI